MKKDNGPVRTPTKKQDSKQQAKVIPLARSTEGTKPEQPSYDTPLVFSLTPNEIFKNILYDCSTFTTSAYSLVTPEAITKEVKFENQGNYCRLVMVEGLDDYDDCIILVVLELKVGPVFLYAEYSSGLEATVDFDWHRGEEALMKIAPLIGIKVERGLVAGCEV